METYKKAAEIINSFLEEGYRSDDDQSEKSLYSIRKSFLESYSPKELEKLSGFDIWRRLWNTSEPGMINALRNNDVYRIFGSAQSQDVKGLPMAYTKKDGWISFYEPQKRLSQDKALKYGEKFRNKLVACVQKIESFSLKSVEDYEELGILLNKELDDRGEHLWFHKYLHILFPDKFSQFHTIDWKRNVLCVLGVEPKDSYYGMEGQLSLINSMTHTKDFHDFAIAIYDNYEGIGEQKVCLISPKEERIKDICSWVPDSYIEIPTEWFQDLYTNPCFQKKTPPERYGKKNHIFVIEKDLRPYGIIHSLADKKNSEKTLSRFGEWRICFSSDDRLPVPRRKEKGKEREIVDYSQLIYIYQHFYNVIFKKNKIIIMLEKHFEDYKNDYVEVKKKRDSLFEHYPAHAMKIDNVFSNEGIYDFKERVLVDLKNADAIHFSGTEDLKNDKDTYYNIWKLIEKGSVVDNGVIDPLVALRIQSIYHPDQYIGINDQTVIDLILIELSLPLLTEQSIENKYQMIQNWITKNFSFAKDDPYKNNYFFIRASCDALDIPFATSQISLAEAEDDAKLPEEMEESLCAPIFEGAKRIITVNSYERDPRAKRECKEYYLKRDGKIVCQICGFDFGKVYGAEYQNMIHVHHIIPISTINKEYKVNPVKDLIPVCPNCHMVLHSGEGISIDELRRKLR